VIGSEFPRNAIPYDADRVVPRRVDWRVWTSVEIVEYDRDDLGEIVVQRAEVRRVAVDHGVPVGLALLVAALLAACSVNSYELSPPDAARPAYCYELAHGAHSYAPPRVCHINAWPAKLGIYPMDAAYLDLDASGGAIAGPVLIWPNNGNFVLGINEIGSCVRVECDDLL
jgi:hypothetical protein